MNNISNLNKLRQIAEAENENSKVNFLSILAKKAYDLCLLEDKLNDNYFKENSFEKLLEENHKIYSNILGKNYETSLGNPDFAIKELGEDLGHAAGFLYYRVYEMIDFIFTHQIKHIEVTIGLLMKCYEYTLNDNFTSKGLINVIKTYELENMDFVYEETIKLAVTNKNTAYKDIVNQSSVEDLRYLFKYGKYISDNEIETAKFLSTYYGVKKIAQTMVNGYIESFERENKDYKCKSTVRVLHYIGQEEIVKELIKEFGKYNLEVIFTRVDFTNPNKQFTYDHRFDLALYYDAEVAKHKEESLDRAYNKYKKDAGQYSGIAVFDEVFGENPFEPKSKSNNLRFNDEQNKIYQVSNMKIEQIHEKYIPSVERSFTMISFPCPAIGDKFEEIFEATMRINTLDSNKWERIQNEIIKVLDEGEYIHVKGHNGNRTDIKVKMHELNNSEKETNFENCIATVNIPVGEVFTSPTLKDTNGLLHLQEVFLNGLKYIDLELIFKDGYVAEYNCKNFHEESKNKKYIEENLLFPHKTLPLGEFAIGTNTLAYVIAKKYNIVPILPILIGEKMGPHFAIGDTCYSYCEDVRVYNQYDGKEIIARDNERSIIRKINPEEAYTGVHIDITIPYDGLKFINAITKEGKNIPIIENGRFVVEGTEELNEPFSEEV